MMLATLKATTTLPVYHLQIEDLNMRAANHKGPFGVDSRRLARSYIRISCASEFGATTDVRQAAGYDFWLEAVLTLSAKSSH